MKRISIFLVLLGFAVSCGPSLETTTVNSDPGELLSPQDSVAVESADDEDDFIHLRLGEIAPIYSLDPLFATTNSELRAINLVYEQLVGKNQTGSLSPELAKRWTVSNDSTEFTLHLRTDIYFHDSPVFGNGSGRRFIANDVRFLFERMADSDVPDFTANRFSDIRGFNAYHREQTLIKDPEKRVLDSIEGLRVRNDSTITFVLNESSSNFLERLTHPQLSVYPRESVPSNPGPIQRAAGTGRFVFIQQDGNNHLFTVNEDYRGLTPDLNRLDIISGLNESDLYQEFARQDLDVLVEVSFPTLETITDSTGNLIKEFNTIYDLENTGLTSDHTLYYNEESQQAHEVNSLLDSLDLPQLTGSRNNWGTIRSFPLDTTGSAQASENTQLVSTQNQHHNERMLLNNLATAATGYGFTFSMNASFALTTSATFATLPYPFTEPAIQWKAPIFILSHANVEGIKLRNDPWELDLVSVEFKEDS